MDQEIFEKVALRCSKAFFDLIEGGIDGDEIVQGMRIPSGN